MSEKIDFSNSFDTRDELIVNDEKSIYSISANLSLDDERLIQLVNRTRLEEDVELSEGETLTQLVKDGVISVNATFDYSELGEVRVGVQLKNDDLDIYDEAQLSNEEAKELAADFNNSLASIGLTAHELFEQVQVENPAFVLAEEIEQFMFERGEYDYSADNLVRWIEENANGERDRNETTSHILEAFKNDVAPLLIYMQGELELMDKEDELIETGKQLIDKLCAFEERMGADMEAITAYVKDVMESTADNRPETLKKWDLINQINDFQDIMNLPFRPTTEQLANEIDLLGTARVLEKFAEEVNGWKKDFEGLLTEEEIATADKYLEYIKNRQEELGIGVENNVMNNMENGTFVDNSIDIMERAVQILEYIKNGEDISGAMDEVELLINQMYDTIEQGYEDKLKVAKANEVQGYQLSPDAMYDYDKELKEEDLTHFLDDAEKMRDFKEISKDDFLASYSYMTEKEYDLTAEAVAKQIATFYEITDEAEKPSVEDIIKEFEVDGVPQTLSEYAEDIEDWKENFKDELSTDELETANHTLDLIKAELTFDNDRDKLTHYVGEDVVAVLEKNDIKFSVGEYGGDTNPAMYAELEFYSNAGEDFIFTVSFTDKESFVKDFEEYARDFDVDEHVKLVMDMEGSPSIAELVEDAKDIQSFLSDVSKEISEETRRDKTAEYEPRPIHYYEPEVGIDGTTEDLFNQAKNGYIEDPKTLHRLSELLERDNKNEEAQLVKYMEEKAYEGEDNAYSVAQMKIDIETHDRVYVDDISIGEGTVLNVKYEPSNDTILIHIQQEGVDGNERTFSEASSTLSKSEFMQMTQRDFERSVDSTMFYNMQETSREPIESDSKSKTAKIEKD